MCSMWIQNINFLLLCVTYFCNSQIDLLKSHLERNAESGLWKMTDINATKTR